MKIVPFATGRATWWGDAMDNGKHCRLYGQVGIRAATHLWRVYQAEDRLFDIHGLKHIITPEATAWLSDASGVHSRDLFPMEDETERHLMRMGGAAVGLHQRLQTRRGHAGERRTVDWMRASIVAGVYSPDSNGLIADGRFFSYRPEYSLAQNHINGEYIWNISDSTALLADANYDIDSGRFRRSNVGLAVARSPRLRYFLGMRCINDMDSTVGTAGFSYKLGSKYIISGLEQFDFSYRGRENLATSFSIVRKFPRWYVGVTFTFDARNDDLGLYLTLYPEGIPEVRLASGRMSVLGGSSDN